jgi:membrane-associated phospholipid phosphatase
LIVAEGLKYLIPEERPDRSSRDSFPSGHATAAFAAATVESDWHPSEAPYWYAGAALISASRVALHRHFIGDVFAGAALGYGGARIELASRRGLVLSPIILPGDGVAFNISKSFR